MMPTDRSPRLASCGSPAATNTSSAESRTGVAAARGARAPSDAIQSRRASAAPRRSRLSPPLPLGGGVAEVGRAWPWDPRGLSAAGAIGARERVGRGVRDRCDARRGLEITPRMRLESFARLAVPKLELAL